MDVETIAIRIKTSGREIAIIETQVTSSAEGAFAHVGPFQVPYRPQLRAGGALGVAYVSEFVARGAGLL